MFNFFFSLNYWITTQIFKNNSYPIISTVAVVSMYQFFVLLFLFDFISFQVLNDKSLIIGRNKIYGFSVISILLIANHFYFNSQRLKIVLKNFNQMKRSTRLRYSILGVFFMMLVIILTVFQAYSIKNNIKWW